MTALNGIVLSVRDLAVAYGNIKAVDGISFDVGEGEIITLIGANGAGKSSALRAVSGMVPFKGQVLYRQKELRNVPPHRIVAMGPPRRRGRGSSWEPYGDGEPARHLAGARTGHEKKLTGQDHQGFSASFRSSERRSIESGLHLFRPANNRRRGGRAMMSREEHPRWSTREPWGWLRAGSRHLQGAPRDEPLRKRASTSSKTRTWPFESFVETRAGKRPDAPCRSGRLRLDDPSLEEQAEPRKRKGCERRWKAL